MNTVTVSQTLIDLLILGASWGLFSSAVLIHLAWRDRAHTKDEP